MGLRAKWMLPTWKEDLLCSMAPTVCERMASKSTDLDPRLQSIPWEAGRYAEHESCELAQSENQEIAGLQSVDR